MRIRYRCISFFKSTIDVSTVMTTAAQSSAAPTTTQPGTYIITYCTFIMVDLNKIADSIVSYPQYVAYFSGVIFYLREKGLKRCPAGSEVMDQDECKEACTSLGIRLSNTFKNGKRCFKAGNGVCKQGGSIGSKALLVCKESGKIIFVKYI